MMNRLSFVLCISVIIISISANILSVFKIKSLMTNVILRDNIIEKMNVSENRLSYLETCLDFNLLYDNLKTIDDIAFNTNETPSSMQDIVGRCPVLVFRYSETNCSDCVAFGALKLASHYKNMDCKPVIFADYSAHYLFKTRILAYNTASFKAYRIANVSNADKNNAPYYFLLNPDKTISDIFLPEKIYPEMVDEYFENIDRKYSFK